MIKEIITNQLTDYSIYIQSAGGNSIIEILYHKPDNFHDAIIYLKYFGRCEQDNYKYSGFKFSVKSFYEFYSQFQSFYIADWVRTNNPIIGEDDERLVISKPSEGISVYKYVSSSLQNRHDYIWEFYLEDAEAKLFIDKIRDMLVAICVDVELSRELNI